MKSVAAKHDVPLSYTYEPDMDEEIIEGRLMMNVFLYTHQTVLSTITTSAKQMLDFCNMNSGITHWKTSAGVRKLQKGLDWMIQRGYVSFTDGGATELAARRYNDIICLSVDPALFNVGLDDAKHTDPFILLYERDIAKILEADARHPEKLLRVYCYIRACLFSTLPYVARISMQNIVEGTGYSISYISKVTRLLCEELGVLHRQALNRTSEQYPPYMYIANIPNWEQYLTEGASEWNEAVGGVPYRAKTSDKAPSAVNTEEEKPLVYHGEIITPDFKFNDDADAKEVFNLPFTNMDAVRAISSFFLVSPVISATDITKKYQLKSDIIHNLKEEAAKVGVDADMFIGAKMDDCLAAAIAGRKIVNGEVNVS